MNASGANLADLADLVLGLDVGGTQTRWALCTASGEMVGEGVAAGFSGARLHIAAEQAGIAAQLRDLAVSIQQSLRDRSLAGLHAGVTGIGDGSGLLVSMLALAFSLNEKSVTVSSDVELTYRGALAPGEGYLIYAGTGSIAAFIDAQGNLFRAGGRGVQLDDAGGGYWIAREALRRIWRREDEQPGAWQHSPMARALFEKVGGDSSIFSARYLMEKTRGEVGLLALAVAQHADADALAAEILCDAGAELARLANAMLGRYGERRVVVAGRASQLHPLIESSLRKVMPTHVAIEFRQVSAHAAAARIAVKAHLQPR